MSHTAKLDPFQEAAASLRGRELIVPAGAGTGKTTVLVERVIRLLREGNIPSLDQLLVVTFTEKAAHEMKRRIYNTLAADESLRRFLPGLPRAGISTIHGFCSRLLKEYFLEAGIDPGFRVLEERGSREAFDDAMRRVFHARFGDSGSEGGAFRALVEMAGYDEEGEVLRKLLRDLHTRARTSDDPDVFLNRIEEGRELSRIEDARWYPPLVARLYRSWREGAELYAEALSLIVKPDAKKYPKCVALRDLLLAAAPDDLTGPGRAGGYFERLAAHGLDVRAARQRGFKWLDMPSQKKPDKSPHFAAIWDAAKDVFGEVPVALPMDAPALLDAARREQKAVRLLVQLARESDRHYQAYKDRLGFLDFGDLEVRAFRLLRDHGEALGMMDRYREILVDEYQDVNPLQERILSMVSRPERRFRVGDVKQSIYQFRLADPKIFLAAVSEAEPLVDPAHVPDGQHALSIFLRRNHRSRPAVLAFVNHVFARLFTKETIGSSYEDQALVNPEAIEQDAAAVATQTSTPSAGHVELHLIVKSKPSKGGGADANDEDADDEDADDADEAAAPSSLPPRALKRAWSGLKIEARLVARRLREWHEAGTGDAGWGQVAILLRSWGSAPDFLEALRSEGIPVQLANGGTLLDEPAARDFWVLLRVLDNPRDDIALAAVLRSPLVSCSDEELLRVRLARPGAASFLDAVVGAAAFADQGDFLPPTDTNRPPAEVWCEGGGEILAPLVEGPLSTRLHAFLTKLRDLRRKAEALDLTRFLTTLLDEFPWNAILPSLGDPVRQRRAIETLIALAKEFERERGSSLHGFVARIEALSNAGDLPGLDEGGAGDRVSILSVHKSKGLEFPVVVLPRMNWGFQFGRLGSKIRLGSDWIGVRDLDYGQWTQRDTPARALLAREQDEAGREEEARIFYVALTRAKEQLWLFASVSKRPEPAPPPPPVLLSRIRRRSNSVWKWLEATLPWDRMRSDERGHLRFDDPPCTVHEYDSNTLALEFEDDDEATSAARAASAVAASSGFRTEAPATGRTTERALLASQVDRMLQRIRTVRSRPSLALLPGLRGKYWVTEFKRSIDREDAERLVIEDGATLWLPEEPPAARDADGGARSDAESGAKSDATSEAESGTESGATRGTRYHQALARLDLGATDAASLRAHFERMAREPWWEGASRDRELELGLEHFFESPLGERLRLSHRAHGVEREVAFSLRWSLERLRVFRPELGAAIDADPRWRSDVGVELLERTWVLLQGRLDCVFRDGDRWVLIDWKTDRVPKSRLPERVDLYRTQMALYREAVERLWGAPVEAWLVFVSVGEVVGV